LHACKGDRPCNRALLHAIPTSSTFPALERVANTPPRLLALLDYESKFAISSSLISCMAVLETSRLALRPFREKDVDLLAELMANPDFMRFSLGPYTREQTQTVLDKILSWNRAGLPSQFAIIMRSNDTLIGYCGFFHQQVDETTELEIGYRLHPDYWNQGLATEAATAVRDHAFGDLKLPRVISLIHPDNVASRRVAEKIGMRFERRTVFKGFPTQIFALNQRRWLTNRAA
jgi:ribosomal-protein-alanine N-acetyltransferase